MISNPARGGRRYLPYAFTEQGVAMLSSVLRSSRAAEVNVAIMRAFVALRRLLTGHDHAIRTLFDAIRELMAPPPAAKREMGFHTLPALRNVQAKPSPTRKPRR